MSDDDHDHRLEARLAAARRDYEDSGSLPEGMLLRLSAARHAAVLAAGRSRPRRWVWPAGLATAAAGAAAAAVLLVVRPFAPNEPPTSPAAMQIMLSGEDYDLYRNLDFYAWAAGQESRKDQNGDKGG